MNRSLIIILAFVILTACSYEPILLNKGINFTIDKIETSGENKTKKKVIISSDAKGDPQIYKLIISTDYIVEHKNNIIIEDNIFEENTYNNISDKFELLKNEENILKTTAQKIADEITISIISSIK